MDVVTGLSILESYDEEDFRRRYRFSKQAAKDIYLEIKDELDTTDRRRVPPFHCLLIALRYYASGTWRRTSGDLLNVSQSSASRIVAKVSPAIAKLYKKYVRFPLTSSDIRTTKQGFYNVAQFPGVIGAIDCTHIHLTAPGANDRERFRNRKGRLSINVQAVVDSNMKFVNVVARWPGSTHDSRIFDNSLVKEWLSRNPSTGWLLGDNGYPCRRYLMTPVLNPISASERNYNRSHIKTRCTIEKTFGAWKKRFFVLSTNSALKTETVLTVIIACAVLWNIRREKILAGYQVDDTGDEDDLSDDRLEFIDPSLGENIHVSDSERGKDVRQRIINRYFSYG